MNNIKDLRLMLGDTKKEFAQRYNIPYRTVQNWELGNRVPPDYLLDLLEKRVRDDVNNKKTIVVPSVNKNKKPLPRRSDYIGATSWLRAVKDVLGDEFVFALDCALMCQGRFLGRNNESIIWGYGDDSLLEYSGVALLGNNINNYDVEERNGLRFTSFNRTLTDSLANEDILDTQGITEALSEYYYSNNESFDGIYVAPTYVNQFETLRNDAVEYYTY